MARALWARAGWKQPLGECVCVWGGGGGQVLVSYRGEYSDSESPKKMWVAQLLSVHSRKEMVLQVFAKSAQEIRGEIRR